MNQVEIVYKRRTSTGTLMNLASKEHGGSSRSHCTLILTLSQYDLNQ
jgi:hypothetical protein